MDNFTLKYSSKHDLSDYTGHAYALVRDSYDPRDHHFAVAFDGVALPTHVDLAPLCSTVEDQGQLGSCTGNAIAGALEYLENKAGATFTDLSRLFIYYNERFMEHTVRQDAGAQIRDGIKSVAHWGVCTEALFPYDVAKYKTRPNAHAFADAYTRRAVTYARVNQDAISMQQCLAAGVPIVIGFTVYDSFESPAVAASGLVPMPKAGEAVLGGHAVLVVGYDSANRLFKVRNSWGAGWGERGYCYMPFDYLTHPALASDFWAIQR